MGKASDTMKRGRKKKGRPSLLDLQKRALEQQQQHQQLQLDRGTRSSLTSSSSKSPQNPNRFDRTSTQHHRPSSHRNHNLGSASSLGGEHSSSDDERKQKKVKLVGRLPSRDDHPSSPPPPKSSAISSSFYPLSCNSRLSAQIGDSASNTLLSNTRKFNAGYYGYPPQQDEKFPKATETQNGTRLVPLDGPTTPLPDRKQLLLILDKLQKKDTRGAFAEPVDPDELPDYHEIIKEPMDFETVKTKLDKGMYANLEQLEADIYLICSNAMEYNPSHTIYFRQARSIQELAKKEFETVRHGDAEPPPKIVRRGRPPKKAVESSALDLSKSSADPSLANSGDDASKSNPYNLRKGPSLHRYHFPDGISRSFSFGKPRSLENYFEYQVSTPVSIRNSKRHFTFSDEGKRDTYLQPSSAASGDDLSIVEGEMKHLIPVGLQVERYSYARSLARFAAALGPTAWRVASRKIRSILPPGVQFGPGWVEERDDVDASSSLSTTPGQVMLAEGNMVASSSKPGQLMMTEKMVPSENAVHGSYENPVQPQLIPEGYSATPVGNNIYSGEDAVLGRSVNYSHPSVSNALTERSYDGMGYGSYSFQAQQHHQKQSSVYHSHGMNRMNGEYGGGFNFASSQEGGRTLEQQQQQQMIPTGSNNCNLMGSSQFPLMNGMAFEGNIKPQAAFESTSSSFNNQPGEFIGGFNSSWHGGGGNGMNVSSVSEMGFQGNQQQPTWQDISSMYGRWNASSSVGFQIPSRAAPSRSSTLQHIGSPPQLDLMLQL